MSLKVRCFATIIECQGDYLVSPPTDHDGHIEIHSKLYEDLEVADFAKIIFNVNREVGRYTIDILADADDSRRRIRLATPPVFTEQSFYELHKRPLPLISQVESASMDGNLKFIGQRFWVFKNYFFAINRNYSKDEVQEVRMRIKYIIKKYDDESKEICEELRSAGIDF